MSRTINEQPDLMTVAEVAQYLKKGKVYVYNAVREGTIPAIHLGKSVRVHRAALDQWLQSQCGLPVKVSEVNVQTRTS